MSKIVTGLCWIIQFKQANLVQDEIVPDHTGSGEHKDIKQLHRFDCDPWYEANCLSPTVLHCRYSYTCLVFSWLFTLSRNFSRSESRYSRLRGFFYWQKMMELSIKNEPSWKNCLISIVSHDAAIIIIAWTWTGRGVASLFGLFCQIIIPWKWKGYFKTILFIGFNLNTHASTIAAYLARKLAFLSLNLVFLARRKANRALAASRRSSRSLW